jgi:hypothetical protein
MGKIFMNKFFKFILNLFKKKKDAGTGSFTDPSQESPLPLGEG